MEKDELIVATKQKMREIAQNTVTAPMETAKLVNTPYDPSMPVADFIGAILNFDSVGVGEDFDYFVVDEDVKQVYLLDTNCNVTSTQITPNTELTLSFAEYTTDDYWICLKALVEAKYDVLARKGSTIMRSLDNIEAKKTIDVIEAAVPTANKHTLATGATKFNYDDLCAMVEDVANYGTGLVLIAGTNVNKDIVLWNFDNDKNKAISPADFGVTVYVVRGTVKIDAGASEDILDPDVAYLVATSDAEEMAPGYFVRRDVTNFMDADAKKRSIINSKPITTIGSNRKVAFAIAGYVNFNVVITNAKTLSRFERV